MSVIRSLADRSQCKQKLVFELVSPCLGVWEKNSMGFLNLEGAKTGMKDGRGRDSGVRGPMGDHPHL